MAQPKADESFERGAARAVEWIGRYRDRLADYPVLARVAPGEVRSRFPVAAPEDGSDLGSVLHDLDDLLVDGLTHWNHPGFFGYFCSSTTDAGVLAELIAAELNQNAMVWRTSPAATELEERMVEWVRRFVGLPDVFSGVILDTASTSSFTALVAAREHALPNVRTEGLAGRAHTGRCRVYLSEHAHSSLDKAAVAAGLGLSSLRHIATDDRLALDAGALERILEADRESGDVPVMVCATIGTTSTTSVDPVVDIAAVCRRHGVWLHVDAAYAGPAASLPELADEFTGWELADSIVLNPHKWMSTPIDCSVLLFRDREVMHRSMWVKPEYLRTADEAPDLMDVGLPLGRRFRALKLWFIFRSVGATGLRSMLRDHIGMARDFAAWLGADHRFELAAPPRFSLVCFRALPPDDRDADDWNRRLLSAVNARGPVFLSHTIVPGGYTLRMAIGSARNTADSVRRAYDILVEEYDHMVEDAGSVSGRESESQQKGGSMIREGDVAPDFSLPSDGGETIRLSNLRGRRVVLYFYPKDDTSGCTKEACSFRDTMPAFEERGAVVLGVSPDPVRSHESFRDKYGLNFPLLADEDHSVAEAYGAWGKKKMYGREYEGILRSTFVIGPDGHIEKAFRKVKPAEHANEVLSELDA